MPVSRKLHQSQFSATPLCRTMLVTRFGVSVLKVVATIEIPTSHQGAARPDVKNSLVLSLARRQKNSAGIKLTAIDVAIITQSIVANWNADATAAGAACIRGKKVTSVSCSIRHG